MTAQLMPPHPENRISERIARVVAADVRAPQLAMAGLNAASGFKMGQFIKGTRPLAAEAAPPALEFHFCILLAGFADKPVQVAAESFTELLFGTAAPDGSVRKYYYLQSGEKVAIVGEVIPVTLPNTYRYYVSGNYGFGSFPRNGQGMALDALQKAAAAGVDFSPFDNDGDGVIDGLGVIHAGSGAELTGNPSDMWSHKWAIPATRAGLVVAQEYYTAPEYWRSPGDMTIGVHAHEIGHLFGLPDLYDIDQSSRGIDRICLMASGSWNGNLGDQPSSLCGPARARLGFAEPLRIESDPALWHVAPGEVCELQVAAGDPRRKYVVEYRPKAGQDSAQPWGGVVIYCVDESQPDNSHEWRPGMPADRLPIVALRQADGQWDLEYNRRGLERGDFYFSVSGAPSWSRFAPETNPSSNWPDGSRTGVIIDVVKASPNGDSADVLMGFESVAGDVNGSATVDMIDFEKLVERVYAGGPAQPGEDVNNDGFPDAMDINALVDILRERGYTDDDFAQAMRNVYGRLGR